jgi:hypothetical protein
VSEERIGWKARRAGLGRRDRSERREGARALEIWRVRGAARETARDCVGCRRPSRRSRGRVPGVARTSWHISSLKSTCRRHPSGADPASAASRYSATWSRFFGLTAALPRG